MRFVFTPHGWEDYTFWQATDRATLKRINRLLDDVACDPFAGIGKPEQLRHALAGAWSRRIDEEHRLVYLVDGDDVVILQARTTMAEGRSGAAGPDASALGDLVAQVIASGAVSAVRRARLVTDGQQHVVVILDEELVARFPRDARAFESLRGEATLLSHLAGRLSAPLPVPVHVDESFTLHRMLHGVVTSRRALGSLERRARERLLDDVGQFLVELGASALPSFAASAATTSLERMRVLRERADRLLVPLLWNHQRQWLDELFTELEAVSFAHTPSLIHGDLAPYHLLHDHESGQLTGILDFGVAGLGDPATDLACLLSVWGERFAGRLAHQWPAACDLIDRARLVAMALPLEWAVIALETNAADMAVAHIGHLAADVAPVGTRFGSAI